GAHEGWRKVDLRRPRWVDQHKGHVAVAGSHADDGLRRRRMSPSFPFSGTDRRNSIVFRPFLRTPTSVVSRCAPACHRKGVSIIRCGVSRGVAARSCLMAGGEIKKFLFACFPTAGAAAFCYLSERIKAGAGVSK